MKILRGTSIIEILIATAMIGLVILSAMSLINRSQSQNTYARNLSEATKYATQAADWVRQQRDILGWTTLASKDVGPYCLTNLPTDFNSLPTPGACDSSDYLANIFFRQITLDTSTPNVLKVTITVSWSEQVPRETSIEMELTPW